MAGQLWAVNAQGGYLYSDELSDIFRAALQPNLKFRKLCDASDATEKRMKRGDKFYWDILSNVSTQGTTLTETATMPETSFTISQGTLTVTEAGNSIPYTHKLDNLSKVELEPMIRNQLSLDAAKCFDILAHAEFKKTPLRVQATGGTATDTVVLTTNGTATQTNNVNLGTGHVKAIVDLMKERNIPPFPRFMNKYGAISHPSTWRPFKNQLESIHQNTPEGFAWIVEGLIGRYEDTLFVEQTFIPKGGAGDSTTWNANTGTADEWNNAKSGWAHFFGGDTVMEAIVVPEEIRGKLPGDYGRSKGVSWYYLGGFGLVRTAAADASIMMWDSAA